MHSHGALFFLGGVMGAGATAVYHANHYDGGGANASTLTPEEIAAYNAAEQERIQQEELFAEIERDWYENEDSPPRTEESEDDWDEMFVEEQIIEEKESVEKYDGLRYHEDGTIVVTDDWTQIEHPKISQQYKPNAVIDTRSSRGTQHDRTVYDANGRLIAQIHGGNHGNPKHHPYGVNGEHIHYYDWSDVDLQGIPKRVTRELTSEEWVKYKDILEGKTDDNKGIQRINGLQ